MPWHRLVDISSVAIYRGARIQFPADYPYEARVEVMVFDPPGESKLGLIVVTGYKAGLVMTILPSDCLLNDAHAISSDWLIENWRNWVYESEIATVLIDIEGQKLPHSV